MSTSPNGKCRRGARGERLPKPLGPWSSRPGSVCSQAHTDRSASPGPGLWLLADFALPGPSGLWVSMAAGCIMLFWGFVLTLALHQAELSGRPLPFLSF